MNTTLEEVDMNCYIENTMNTDKLALLLFASLFAGTKKEVTKMILWTTGKEKCLKWLQRFSNSPGRIKMELDKTNGYKLYVEDSPLLVMYDHYGR